MAEQVTLTSKQYIAWHITYHVLLCKENLPICYSMTSSCANILGQNAHWFSAAPCNQVMNLLYLVQLFASSCESLGCVKMQSDVVKLISAST